MSKQLIHMIYSLLTRCGASVLSVACACKKMQFHIILKTAVRDIHYF